MASVAAVLGAILVPAAWLGIAHRGYTAAGLDAVDARFIGLYMVGSAVMAWHALQIGDVPFLLLHLTMTLFTATELALLGWMGRVREDDDEP